MQWLEEMKRRKPDLQTAIIPRCGHCPSLRESESISAVERFLDSIV